MKSLSCVLLAAAIPLLALWFFWPGRDQAFAQEKAPGAGVNWEYRVLAPDEDAKEMEKTLNQLGEQGWDLSHTVSKVRGGSAGTIRVAPSPPLSAFDTKVYLILKRPKR